MKITQQIFVFILLICATVGQSQVITFANDQGVFLRWSGIHETDVQGYAIYRSENSGEFSKIAETAMVTSPDQLRALLGGKVHLYSSLFGKNIEDGPITAQDFSRIETESESLFRAVCLINPDFGTALGESYNDRAVIPGNTYDYRIETIRSGGTGQIFTASVRAQETTSIPAVADIQGIGRAQSALISWQKMSAAMKSGDVVSYNVYRADSPEGSWVQANNFQTLSATVTTNGQKAEEIRESFQDPYLKPGKKYYFMVRAMNAFGFEGPSSDVIEVIPVESNTLLSPRSLEATQLGATAKITWEGARGVDFYEVYLSPTRSNFKRKASLPATSGPLQTWITKDIVPGEEFFLFVKSLGRSGQSSAPSDTLRVFFVDKQKPDAPTNVRASAERGVITVSWSPNTENDLLGYQVERSSDGGYKDLFLLTDAPIAQRSFKDELPASSETTYGYVVFAVDKSYNRSEPSTMVFTRMPDETAPQPPIVTGFERVGDSLQFNWQPCVSEDFHHYEIEISDDEANGYKSVLTTNSLSGKARPETDGKYYYRVVAVDRDGNRGASQPLLKNFEARKQPDATSELLVEVDGRNLKVSWAPVENQDVGGYLLTRKDLSTGKVLDIAELGSNYNEWLDLYVDLENEYEYTLRTYDSKWRMSSPARVSYRPDE